VIQGQRARAISSAFATRHATIRGHTGLYGRGREPDNASRCGISRDRDKQPLARVDRSWRGIVTDTYALEN